MKNIFKLTNASAIIFSYGQHSGDGWIMLQVGKYVRGRKKEGAVFMDTRFEYLYTISNRKDLRIVRLKNDFYL